MAKTNHSAVVSAATLFPGPLDEAVFKLTRGNGKSVGTGGFRPKSPRAKLEEGFPATYVEPTAKYVLVEEADKRFRLVRTAVRAKVTWRSKRAPKMATGIDNRVQMTNTTAWPNCVHGHVIITYPDNKQYIGSGTMVN